MKKICVYGAGAVGGHVAARLIAAGQAQVSVVARGAHLAAIQARGLTLHSGPGQITAKPLAATDDAATLPPQDMVIVGLKAPAQPSAAEAIGRLLAPGGWAVFLTNGIPWWWRHGLPGQGGTLELLDPDAALWRHVRPERALGCIANSSNEVVEPGMIRHNGANRWTFGEPDGSSSARLAESVALFRGAGLNAEASADIRRAVWQKLALNMSGSPISALTRTMSKEFLHDAELRRMAQALVRETLAVAAATGWDVRAEVNVDEITDPVARAGGGRSSMMQDALAGRRMEADAIVGQVRALAREKGVATPVLDVVYPLLCGLDRSSGH